MKIDWNASGMRNPTVTLSIPITDYVMTLDEARLYGLELIRAANKAEDEDEKIKRGED